MKVLCLYGSPRKNGNTDIMMDKFVEGLESSKGSGLTINKFRLAEMDIHPCRECRACDKTGKCIITDSMQHVYPELETANYIIVSSPIFFCNVTATLKTLIDRTQCYWAKKYILKQKITAAAGPRYGVYLGCCGSRHIEFFDGASLTVKYFFDGLEVKYLKDFFASRIDNKGDILRHGYILNSLYEFGRLLISETGAMPAAS